MNSFIVTIFMTRLHWDFQKVFFKRRRKNGSLKVFSKFMFIAYFFPNEKCNFYQLLLKLIIGFTNYINKKGRLLPGQCNGIVSIWHFFPPLSPCGQYFYLTSREDALSWPVRSIIDASISEAHVIFSTTLKSNNTGTRNNNFFKLLHHVQIFCYIGLSLVTGLKIRFISLW